MANLNPQVLKKAGEMGIIKGKTLGSIKQQIIATSANKDVGAAKFKNVQRTIFNPTSSKTSGQLKEAIGILTEAGVVKSEFKHSPTTLLQQAQANIAAAEKKVSEEKKEELRERSKKARLEEEGVIGTGRGGRGGLLEQIEKEHASEDNAIKVLEEAKKGGSDDHVSAIEAASKPKDKPIVEMSID
jgi:hypothetical protein